MATSINACNFSCSCVRDDCSFKHRIENLELRKEFKMIADEMYDRSIHNETDPDGIRHKPCFHGFLCNNEECGYKHRCSFSGRKIIQDAWYHKHKHPERKQLTTDDAEQLKKLIDKYMMNFEEGELIKNFSRLIRHTKD